MFELAWTLLAQRRYKECADAFIRLTELNSWYLVLPFKISWNLLVFFCRSHTTYYFAAAGELLLSNSLMTSLIILSIGCYFSLGDMQKAQQLLDTIPSLLERKKVGGKDLPTEVFIKKKCAFHALPLTLRFIDGFGGNNSGFL